jgi:hypothetical protein
VFAAGQVSGGEHECADSRVRDGFNLQFAAADVAVFRQHDPVARPDHRKPFAIGCSGCKMVVMHLNVGAGGA